MEWIVSLQGYPLILLTTLLEGMAIPLPGGLLLAWSGFILGRDMADLAMATGLGVTGYMLGSIIPYLLGRFGGRPAVEKVFLRFRIPTGHIDLAQQWFNRYGLIIIAVSRPFLLGNYISFIAGMAKTRLIPFLICTGLGIMPWVFVYIYLGMIFGKHWPKAVEIAGQYSIAGLGLILLAVLVFIFTGRLAKTIR